MASKASLALAMMLAAGCAPGSQRVTRDTIVWDRACASTPIRIGHVYSQEDWRAMKAVRGDTYSVEEFNRICAER